MDNSEFFDLLRVSYSKLIENNPLKDVIYIPPIRYFLELTYRCNLRCPFCFINEDRHKNEMTTHEWLDIIHQIPFFAVISLVAGEVMIRDDFNIILENACMQTLGKVSLITNGLLLDEDRINSFIKNNMLLLSVSIDGFEKNHDLIRNKKGLWDNICLNLEYLKKQKEILHKKRPMLDIKSVILENNLDDLPKIYKKSAELNADFYSLSFKRNNYLRQNSKLYEEFSKEFYAHVYPLDFYFDREHFIEVYKELESLSKKLKTKIRYAPKFKPIGDLDKILNYFSLGNKNVKDIYKPCYIPYSSLFITPEGDVYPCLSYKAGNVKGRKIKSVYNCEKYKNFRKMLKKHKIFNACQLCCDAYPINKP